MASTLSTITSIIDLLKLAKQAYDKVQDAKHLPQAFAKIHLRIDLATQTLVEVRGKYVENSDEEVKISGTLEGCQRDAEHLQQMYEVVCTAANSDWYPRYKGYISNMVRDRKGKVEDVWKDLLEGLDVLRGYHQFKNLSTAKEVAAAIKEAQDIESSLPDEEARFNNYGQGSMNVNTGTGTQRNYSQSGGTNSKQYIAETMTFGKDD